MSVPQAVEIAPNQCGSVLLLMMPEWSALLPTLPLVKSLRDRGVRVIYGGIDPSYSSYELYARELSRFKAYIESEGFEYYFYNAPPECRTNLETPSERPVTEFFRTLQEVERLVEEQAVDLVLVDAILEFQGLAAAKCGVPVATLGTNFLSFTNSDVPPFTSSMLPGANGFLMGKVLSAWASRYLNLNCAPWLSNPIRSSSMYFRSVRPLKQMSYSFGLKYGFTEYGIRPRLPTNLLCPQQLDFPGAGDKNYLGLNVDPSRSEDDFLWGEQSDGRPMIYCSLGSQSYLYFSRTAETFLEVVIEAFLQREDYQLVLHIGVDRSVEEFPDLPPRIKVCSWAPQLAVLKRAAAAITHGGLNTIQECIFSGVPMVVFASVNDGPGNAARVVHHGLGVRGNPRRCSVKQLLAKVDEVVNNKVYADNVARMRDRILDQSDFNSGVKKLRALVI